MVWNQITAANMEDEKFTSVFKSASKVIEGIKSIEESLDLLIQGELKWYLVCILSSVVVLILIIHI